MALKVIHGNIFTSQCQTIVNTVNCVGVMGAGIALECRLRFPSMYQQYLGLCKDGRIDIGVLWLCKSTTPWVLNFPTKKHWKYPTKEQYLHAGLQKFMAEYMTRGIETIAFPLLGAQHGGLDPARSLDLMQSYLGKCTIPVEIYTYDKYAKDDLYEQFKARVLDTSIDELKILTGLRSDFISRIRTALGDPAVCQLNQLANVDGIGEKTLEKAFAFMRTPPTRVAPTTQQGLDF